MLAPNTDVEAFFKARWTGVRSSTRRKRWAAIAAVFLMLVAGGEWWWARTAAEKPVYTIVAARHGDLTIVVSATGTVNPVNEVTVSSELSGMVATVNVDFDDPVKAGQVLATIKTDKLQAEINSNRAELEAAKAEVVQAEATVTEKSRTLSRNQSLVEKNAVSQQDLDSAQAAYDRAVAALASARAQVDVKAANLAALESDLVKAEIRSPINGIVLDREVDPGSTVAASLNAPTLFKVAEDLKAMRVLADIDEADAGKVAAGQDARFTVEAYPERTFQAKVIQLRYASKTTNNVVTYTGVLAVDNSDMAIRPGMTATVDIIVKHEKNVLVIPNAALRFAPAAATGPAPGGNWLRRLMPRPPQPASSNAADDRVPAGKRQIWALRNGEPQSLIITPGSTDGTWTAIKDGDLADGDAVITDATPLPQAGNE